MINEVDVRVYEYDIWTISVMALLNDWSDGEPEYECLLLECDDSNQSPRHMLRRKSSYRGNYKDMHYATNPSPGYLQRFISDKEMQSMVTFDKFRYDYIEWSTARLVKIHIKTTVETELEEIE